MNVNNKWPKIVIGTFLLAAGFICAVPGTGLAAAGTSDEAHKTVRSSGGLVSERGDAPLRDRSEFVETETIATERPNRSTKGDSATAAAVLEEAWIYDADIELFDDFDGDGFFTFLRVSFDADSIYPEHWIYARLFVSLDGVTWDEYHITDDILIEGASPADAWEVETELLAGFEPGLYDVLIELYDADFGHFLGEFGPVQSSAFSLVPLEDIDRDTVPPVVVVDNGGGGAAGLPTLAALLLLVAVSVRRRRLAPGDSGRTSGGYRRNSVSAVD